MQKGSLPLAVANQNNLAGKGRAVDTGEKRSRQAAGLDTDIKPVLIRNALCLLAQIVFIAINNIIRP